MSKCLKCSKTLRRMKPTTDAYFDGWDSTMLHKKCWTEMMRSEGTEPRADDEGTMPCVRCHKIMNVSCEGWGGGTMHKKCWRAKMTEDAPVCSN